VVVVSVLWVAFSPDPDLDVGVLAVRDEPQPAASTATARIDSSCEALNPNRAAHAFGTAVIASWRLLCDVPARGKEPIRRVRDGVHIMAPERPRRTSGSLETAIVDPVD
jgi:hypothetical protein